MCSLIIRNEKNPIKLEFIHIWETLRKNYLQSPFAAAAQLLWWTPVPWSWQALAPPGIKTTSLPVELMQPPQYNQPNNVQQYIEMHMHKGTQQDSTFSLAADPTAFLTWLTENAFHMFNKKEISLKFRRCRGNEQTEFNSPGDFNFYFLLCSFPPLTNCQLQGDIRKLGECNWYFVAVAYSYERFSQKTIISWQ